MMRSIDLSSFYLKGVEKRRGRSYRRERERVKGDGVGGDKREREGKGIHRNRKEFFKTTEKEKKSIPVKQKHKQNSYFGNLHWRF